MNTSMISSLSAMRAAQMRIDSIGNNIANVNTDGYKSQDEEFGSVLAGVYNTLPKDPVGHRVTPSQLHIGNGSVANLQRYDYSIGTPEVTNVPTDLYIDGNAYFQVMVNGTEPRYTRMGNFTLSLNANGQTLLTTQNGHPVQSTAGTSIIIPNGYDFQVDGDGQVRFVNKTNKSDILQGPVMALYTIPNRQVLEEKGNGEFSVPATAIQPTPAQGATVKQGYLEQSNVDLRKEMTNLLETQRIFQFNSRALSFIDQMNGVINNINSK